MANFTNFLRPLTTTHTWHWHNGWPCFNTKRNVYRHFRYGNIFNCDFI